MNFLLASVIINCHSGEKYLSKCIKSILNQTYKNLEIVSWDNCSTDNSKKTIKSFKDKRIKYFKNNNFTSLYASRNLAIKKGINKIIVNKKWENI
jgi:glycosyltransferase involved in cell wall biosynthesis